MLFVVCQLDLQCTRAAQFTQTELVYVSDAGVKRACLKRVSSRVRYCWMDGYSRKLDWAEFGKRLLLLLPLRTPTSLV